MKYAIREGKESTFISGKDVILAECNQEQLKEIYDSGDKRFIEIITEEEELAPPPAKKKSTRKKKSENEEVINTNE